MRHLIACSSCKRQYDASGLALGIELPCVCGQRVTVCEPLAHDARVVRCSACGASRAEGRAACTYCGSDFTLHEQDLHTICPACFARVSDRARFCHHCAVAIAPQPAEAAGRVLACPTCTATNLQHRALPEAPAVLECARCLGFWIQPEALRQLLRRAAAGSDAARLLLATGVGRRPTPAMEASTAPVIYRACPQCSTRMNRKRFPGGAPVVVDFCRDHGLWFEAEELRQVLQAASDGLGEAREVGRLPGDEAKEREARRLGRNEAWRAQGPLAPLPEATLWDDLLELLGRLFTRRF